MSAKHTPGPWSVERDQETDDGFTVAMGERVTGLIFAYEEDRMDDPCVDAEVEANAKLIAAAPTLADALQVLLDNSSAGNRANLPTFIAAAADAIAALRLAGRIP